MVAALLLQARINARVDEIVRNARSGMGAARAVDSFLQTSVFSHEVNESIINRAKAILGASL